MEIVEVEWTSEYGTKILRIIADKPDGLNIDDATLLNEAISLALDEEDFISDDYMLEVSSLGIERELKTQEDIKKAISQYVHCDFIDSIPITSKKSLSNIEGYLRDYQNQVLTIEYNNKGQKKMLEVDYNQIKFIRLAIKF